MMKGILWGRWLGSFPKPWRLPTMMARTSAATPELISTTVPPAKSITCPNTALTAPSGLQAAAPHHEGERAVHEGDPDRDEQAQELNLARSAMAPLIRATVTMAKVARVAGLDQLGRPDDAAQAEAGEGLPKTPSMPLPAVME